MAATPARDSRPWRAAAARVSMMLALGIPRAQAADAPAVEQVRVEWTAPSECPSAEAARVAVLARLGTDVATSVRAQVVRNDAGFVADVRIVVGALATTRTLVSPSCDTLLDATALLAATVADEVAEEVEVAQAAPEDPPEALVPQPAVPSPPEVPPAVIDEGPDVTDPPRVPARTPAPATPPPTPTRRAAPPVTLYADLRAHAGIGVAPDVDLGLGGVLGVFLPHLALEIGGAGGLPRRAPIEGAAAHVRVRWWSLEVRGCGRWRFGPDARLAVLPCVAGLGGGYDGAAEGPAVTRTTSVRDVWLALGVGPGLTLGLGPARRIGLFAGVEGLAMLRRPAFAVAPVGETSRVDALGLRGTLGVRVQFSVTDRGRSGDMGR